MKIIALLLALVVAVFAQNQRIIGGSVTDTVRYPFQVAIVQQVNGGYSAFCGGSIIGSNYVLTAAHCFRSFNNGNNVDRATSNVYAASTSKISDIRDNKRYSITGVNIHPGFTASNSFADQVDICILRVSTIAFDSNTKPVVLARSQDTSLFPPGTTSYVSGFGTTNGNNVGGRTGSNDLLQVSVPTISTSTCQSVLNQNGIAFNYPIVCAGADGRDACQGDSGGPLVVVVNSNVYMQIGAVVSGTVASTAPVQCGAAGQYGVYIDIASYRSSFIEPITGALYNLGDSGVATNNGTGTPSSSSFVTYSVGLFATVVAFALF